MKVTLKYHGYDDEDHEVSSAWATKDRDIAVFMAGRNFERRVRIDRDAVEPAWGHEITVEEA
jgi:hypothetical protein